jgi:hypothetical protein
MQPRGNALVAASTSAPPAAPGIDLADDELADLAALIVEYGQSVERPTLVRFLLANKGNVVKAALRLDRLLERRAAWCWSEIDDASVAAALDGRVEVQRGRGYWQVGGADTAGRPTAWLFQGNSTPPESLAAAQAGVKAAHTFFASEGGCDAEVLREGIVLVIVMSGVRVSELAVGGSNKFAGRVGNAYTHVMPLRVRSVLMVDASNAAWVAALGVAAAALDRKARAKMEFVDFEQLASLPATPPSPSSRRS